jgi:cysteine synthase A
MKSAIPRVFLGLGRAAARIAGAASAAAARSPARSFATSFDPSPSGPAAVPLLRVHAGDARADFAQLVGNTPLVRLRALSAATGCEVLGKAEFMNAGGSVKDRAALYLVALAERAGQLRPGGTVVEGTAGNTGIGLAHVCNSRGYRLVIYMPDTQSQEKIDLLRTLGADVRPVPAVPITDPKHYTFQARDHAASLGAGAVWTNQFDNVHNRQAHLETTGPEIWRQTHGRVDAFVCATGTGGTLAGVSRALKEASGGRTKIFLADPPGSVLHSWVQTGKLERSGSSVTEGIGQGRVTDNLAGTAIDGSLLIEDARTIACIFRLLKDEGLFVGASSALNCVAAGDVAARLGPGHTVVTVVCDGAGRYQSRLFSRKWLELKGLYSSVPEDCRHLVTLA